MKKLQINNNSIQPQVPSLESLQDFIKRWNSLYPIDRWWRTKYKIPLNSTQHKETNIIDMRLDYEEDFLFNQAKNEMLEKQSIQSTYVGGRGNWLKLQKNTDLSKEEIDDVFDKVDLDNIIDNPDGTIEI